MISTRFEEDERCSEIFFIATLELDFYSIESYLYYIIRKLFMLQFECVLF